MRRMDNYTLFPESLEDQRAAKRYHPATRIKFRDKNGTHFHTISCGTSDYVRVFRDGYLVVVLTWNTGLDYCGVEVFDGTERFGEYFTDKPNESLQLRKEWDQYEPVNLAKFLLEYIY